MCISTIGGSVRIHDLEDHVGRILKISVELCVWYIKLIANYPIKSKCALVGRSKGCLRMRRREGERASRRLAEKQSQTIYHPSSVVVFVIKDKPTEPELGGALRPAWGIRLTMASSWFGAFVIGVNQASKSPCELS